MCGAPVDAITSPVMLLYGINHRLATAIRLAGLILIGWSLAGAKHHPADHGRGLVVAVCLAACAVCWLTWTVRVEDDHRDVTPELYGLAGAGGVLLGAAPDSAAGAFVFIAMAVAAIRVELARTAPLLATGVVALAGSTLVYGGSALGSLAYTLGFAGVLLAASNRRQTRLRVEQAELLLAQTQRSHEEQLRAARFEESARIAREIHDVLAHTLAGLTIQLEATSSLLEQGAGRDAIMARVQRAHTLARDGLQETRRAVGALRGDPVSAPAGIEALVADYRESAEAPVELTIDGDPGRLAGPTGAAVLRVVQEALTNVRKHAPGARVSVAVHAGRQPADELVVRVEDRVSSAAPSSAPDGLAASGGAYGVQGMRERAQLLGGTLSAGATGEGWRVELRLPALDGASGSAAGARPASAGAAEDDQ
jgi:signal transduction histidine kinase